MKISEKETHEAKYLIIEYEDAISELDEKLIDNLESRSLLKPHSRDAQGSSIRYDISQYETLAQYLVNRKLSRTEMVGLLAQLRSVIGVLEDHMLSDGNILLEPDQILIDSVSRRVRFVPVHTQEGDFTGRIRPLIEAMFLHADISHVETLYFASELMKVLLKGNVHLYDMMALIDHQKKEPAACEMWRQTWSRNAENITGGRGSAEDQQVTVLLSEEETGQKEYGLKEPAAGQILADAPLTQELEEKKGVRGLFSGIGARVRELVEGEE